MMRIVTLAAMMLALSSCGAPKIVCDAEGMIVIPENGDLHLNTEWATRNLDLANRRVDDATGMKPVPDYLRQSLAKAEGCP